jgi:hypothetical protein
MTDADFRDLFARLEQPVDPRPEFVERLLSDIDDLAHRPRPASDPADAGAGAAKEPDGAAGQHGYLAEKEDHPMFTFTGPRPRRSRIIVALAIAALIAIAVVVVTRPSTSHQLKIVPTAPTPGSVPTVPAPTRQPQLYFADQAAIGRANLDGTGVDRQLVNGVLASCGMAVDSTFIYWAYDQAGTVARANRDGTSPNIRFIFTDRAGACGVAVDGAHIYWANTGDTNGSSGTTIGRANLDGTGVNQSFITGAKAPCGVAVDGAHIYWANESGGTIGRANLDATGVDENFISGLASPCGVTLDSAHIYVTNVNTSTIARANLDGTGVNQSFITGAVGPGVCAHDGTYLYLVNTGVDKTFVAQPSGTSIGRAKVDGTDVQWNFITGLKNPSGCAIGR